MSDLPGPGRGIDKLYSRAGRILELCIYRFAHRCGYGPHAVYERFSTLAHTRILRFMFFQDGNGVIAKTAIAWDKLLEYAQ